MASPVELRHFPDQIHGFLTMGKIVRAAQPALDGIAALLQSPGGWRPRE